MVDVRGQWYMSGKKRTVKVSEDKVQIFHHKNKDLDIKHIFKFEQCLGLTKSLRQGSTNFIMHFRNTEDEEWLSDQRDELLKCVAERYRSVVGKGISLFGSSAPNLSQFVTTEKDVARNLNRMPGNEYLIQDKKIDPLSKNPSQDQEEDDDMFDDWVLISVEPKKKTAKLEQWNNEEYIKKATLDMTSSESKALMVGKDAAYSDNI